MNKKIILSLILFLLISFSLLAVVPDVKPNQFTGTWLMKQKIDGEIIKRIWVVSSNSTNTGKLITYKLNGEKDYTFTWEYYTENVYLLNYYGAYIMYNVYYLGENVRRFRNYEDVTDQFEIYKISDSQSGFPENF